MRQNANRSKQSGKRCEECKKPLRRNRGAGRKPRYCGGTCRSAARRGRNFFLSGRTSSGAARNGKSNARFTRVSRAGIGGRAIANTVKPTGKRLEVVIECELGLPKAQPGKLVVVNLRSTDRRPVIISAPNSGTPSSGTADQTPSPINEKQKL